jgi:hypothetical protein
MIITGARLSGNDLILSLVNPVEAGKIVHKFNAGDYEIRPVPKKRSLDANAYAWVLIHKIAAKIQEPAVEVYRRYIRDIGSKVTVVCVQADDVEDEVNSFLFGHIGRMVDIGESKIPGCATIHKKYGSSNYSVREMAAFLDVITQDCMALDIETQDQGYIDSLLGKWGDGGGE